MDQRTQEIINEAMAHICDMKASREICVERGEEIVDALQTQIDAMKDELRQEGVDI